MSEIEPVIPADIWFAAENALDMLLCNCREAGDVRQDSIRDIARAILAERERCAAITKGFPGLLYAIRNPHSLPTSSPVADSPTLSPPGASGPHSTQGAA